MKAGMVDVGILCKEPRIGNNNEKGGVPKKHTGTFLPVCLVLEMNEHTFKLNVIIVCVFSDCSITKFLNRILGLEVHKQNHLFQYFTDNFDYLIDKDKKEGKYDMGILGMVIKCNVL